MTRKISRPDEEKPVIDRAVVRDFFEARAEKVEKLGPTLAVIYQDKKPDLAARRDVAEKTLLFPKLQLTQQDHLLDAGCGTGRWSEIIIPEVACYHGADVSPGLIRVAKERYEGHQNAHFSVCALDELSFEAIDANSPFTRVLACGVFIYMNDDEVLQSLQRIASMSAPKARMIFREPVGVDNRLTLSSHYSDDMEQFYSAIYRTEAELIEMCDATLGKAGFKLTERGDVYADADLNNRAETKQRWYIFER